MSTPNILTVNNQINEIQFFPMVRKLKPIFVYHLYSLCKRSLGLQLYIHERGQTLQANTPVVLSRPSVLLFNNLVLHWKTKRSFSDSK